VASAHFPNKKYGNAQTASYMLASILEEAGYKVGMATTVSFKIGDRVWMNDSNKSVLPPLQLQKLIKEMRDAHCNALIIEVTSHSIDQARIWGIPFKYVGLTNITHDHLDYHPTWAHYQATKLKLFLGRSLKGAAANIDDESGPLFLAKTKATKRTSFSTQTDQPDLSATDHIFAHKISSHAGGSSFTLQNESESVRVHMQLPGRFNIENALCAAAMAANLNLKLTSIAAGLQNLAAVPGRLEKIETRKGFSVMVDYAHTPDSLEKLYSTLRPDVRGRMIAILGSCGDRDKTKRPIMGALAARFCDYVFVTDEEPYTENPLVIIEDVAKGVPRGRPLFMNANHKSGRLERPILKKTNETGEGEWWWKVPDRRLAISKALDMAKLDDVILLTGMGAQNFKIVGERQVPWNDRVVVEELLVEKKLAL
jgi:UDP-N-acetylmuramoyl-L-alanyl-D-glutamate--2,6-diaminopimelate ligase